MSRPQARQESLKIKINYLDVKVQHSRDGIMSNRPDTRSSRLTVIRFCIIAGQVAQ